MATDFQCDFFFVVRRNSIVNEGQHRIIENFRALFRATFELADGFLFPMYLGSAGNSFEFIANHRYCLFGVDVTYQNDRHILRAIPCIIEIDQFTQLGIFQVFGETDNGTGIRVISECLFIDELSHSRSAVVFIHVVLFVCGFQFGLEAPEYGVYKTFGIDFEPFFELRGREGIVIFRLVVACAGV